MISGPGLENQQDAPSCPVVLNDTVSSPMPLTLMVIASRKELTCMWNCAKKMFTVFDTIGVSTVFQRIKLALVLNSKNGCAYLRFL
jgi:hypothetical protein